MLIFSCPAVIDLILFLVLFAVSYGAGERGMTLAQCAWLGGIFQLAYMAGSLAAGPLLSRRNARAILIGSTLLAVAGATVCLMLRAFLPLLMVLAVTGMASAFVFNSFQTFMRGEAQPGGLARTTAAYTLAWSIGASGGYLLSGSLYRMGAVPLALLTCGIGAFVLTVLLTHRPRSHESPSADDHVEPGRDGADVAHASYVWVAWTLIFATMFAQRPLQTFYPVLCAQRGVSPALTGLPLFLHMCIQGVCGGLMFRLRPLLYRRGPLAAIQIAAALLFVVLWYAPGYAFSAAVIAILGVWSGFAYFCAVYYAGNSGRRSRNVGVNEFLVGLGSLAGLFVSERFMKRSGNASAMYLVCAVALLVAAAAQWLLAGGSSSSSEPSALR